MKLFLTLLVFIFSSIAFCGDATDPCAPEEPEPPDTEPQECMSVEMEE